MQSKEGGDVAQLVERRTGTPLTQVRFPGAVRDFSPRVNFRCRLSYGVRTTQCAIACSNVCAHGKDPVVHVRVRWIMETLKCLECTVGWVARLCRSWLSPGAATRISHGRNPFGVIQFLRVKKKKKKVRVKKKWKGGLSPGMSLMNGSTVFHECLLNFRWLNSTERNLPCQLPSPFC